MNFIDSLKLRLLIRSYKQELKKGNTEHYTDLIASMVLMDLKDDLILKTDDVEKMTLYDLIMPTKDGKYKVPSIKEINILKKKYADKLWRFKTYEKAATTWIEMMIRFGMIEPKQIINPKEYVLNDLITDAELTLLVMPDIINEISIDNPKLCRKKSTHKRRK